MLSEVAIGLATYHQKFVVVGAMNFKLVQQVTWLHRSGCMVFCALDG